MKRFLVLILLMSCVLSIPRLEAQSTESRPTQPVESSSESDPLVCIRESELTRIIQEEVSRAVDLAVQQAVAEERGKRVAAEIRESEWKGKAQRRGLLAGFLGVWVSTWLTFNIVELVNPDFSFL